MKGYQPMPLEPGVFYAIRTAAKEHQCATRKGCTIQPGEKYVDQVTAPWTVVVDDVDDDGRPRGDLLGHWERFHYHERHETAGKTFREANPNAYPESQRHGGGDPLADYLHAKGEG